MEKEFMDKIKKELEEEIKTCDTKKERWCKLLDYGDDTFEAFKSFPPYVQYAVCEGNPELEAFLKSFLGVEKYQDAFALHKVRQQLSDEYVKRIADSEAERLNEFQSKCNDATDMLNKKRKELKQAAKAYAELVTQNINSDTLDDGGEEKLYRELNQVRQQYDAIRAVYWCAWFDLINCSKNVEADAKIYIDNADSETKPILKYIVKVCSEIISK